MDNLQHIETLVLILNCIARASLSSLQMPNTKTSARRQARSRQICQSQGANGLRFVVSHTQVIHGINRVGVGEEKTVGRKKGKKKRGKRRNETQPDQKPTNQPTNRPTKRTRPKNNNNDHSFSTSSNASQAKCVCVLRDAGVSCHAVSVVPGRSPVPSHVRVLVPGATARSAMPQKGGSGFILVFMQRRQDGVGSGVGYIKASSRRKT